MTLYRLLAIFLLMPALAQAATFCITGPGMAPQCLYEDVVSCRQAATPPSTACIVNPEAPLSFYGGSRYCTLGAERIASCIYTDRGQCNRDADNGAGICIDREAMADDISPFRFDNRLQN
jgi:hypothetical protein